MEQLEPQFPTVNPDDLKKAFLGKGLPDGEDRVAVGFRVFLLKGRNGSRGCPNRMGPPRSRVRGRSKGAV